jgi:chorismate dehydratase
VNEVPHLSAVSYLNTLPLVWGVLHGPQQGLLHLDFDLPAVCAARIQRGEVSGGLIPVVEAQRQNLQPIGELGIACRGAVRSILLISKVPVREIQTLAMDASSRSSVMLARILLEERYAVDPTTLVMTPDLASMLGAADAALIIGDPALRLDPDRLRSQQGLVCLDLGQEWWEHTGLPMVFAIWAGRQSQPELAAILEASYAFGRSQLAQIATQHAAQRHISEPLAVEYFTRYIQYEIDAEARQGMELYLKKARRMDLRIKEALAL